jgi:hypothetical protein
MIDRLSETGRRCGMEMNVERTKVMRISRQPSTVEIMVDEKQLENAEYFNYLCSMITNDARYTREIKSRTALAKAAFNKKTLFISKLDLNLRTKLVKYYIWSVALYDSDTLTLRKVDQRYLGSSEMWCWRRMEKINWTDRVRDMKKYCMESRRRGIIYIQ